MITFSFRPSRRSVLPQIDASVRTLVVSWKDAAEMKHSVESDALVMPSRIGSARGLLARPPASLVRVLEDDLLDLLADQEVGVADLLDAHPAQHLADDDLDVLVVDRTPWSR